jgi:hypothetical protein
MMGFVYNKCHPLKLRDLAELPSSSNKDSDNNEVNHSVNGKHVDLLNQTVETQSMERWTRLRKEGLGGRPEPDSLKPITSMHISMRQI